MTKFITPRMVASALALALGIPLAALAKEDNAPAKLKLDPAAINRDAHTGNSYAGVIKKAAPSVVNIYSTKTTRGSRFHQLFDDPSLNRFFGNEEAPSRRRPRERKEESLGSGVIVTEDGYILTNNHVVEGADVDGVKVALGDGKQKLNAKVIGTDPQTDIAVIKVEGNGLPAIAIADSDKLEVGDVVLAIGNPFNVGQSVAMGIISALGRGGFNITDYEDFIQTDAAINPGNSGGALVDAEGRLIGINQSIVSGSGGNQGVGFAVPVNQARSVLDRLVNDGRMTRGYLGVIIQPLTPELAKEFNVFDTSGALVGGVTPNTPAAAAGLQEGDVIVEVNGKKASDSRHVRLMISQTPPNTKITIAIFRDGKSKTLTAKLGELPGAPVDEGKSAAASTSKVYDALDGVEVGDLDATARRQFDVPDKVRGAVVTNMDPASNSFEAGLRTGNVIQEINRQPVRNADDAVQLSGQAAGERVLLRVWSRADGQSGSRFVTVDNTKKK